LQTRRTLLGSYGTYSKAGAMKRMAATVLAVLAATPAAAAPSTDEVLREFQLFGTWAVDCAAPASPANPHVSDASMRAGLILEDHDLGAGNINRYRIVTAERLSEARLALDVIFRPGDTGEERQKLELTVRNGTRRTMFNRPEDGPVRVRNGAVVGAGLKTPLLSKCE
jgi:hypothetical protein